MSVSPKNFAALLLLAVIWGLSIPITKLGLADIPPTALTALRYASAAAVLLVVALMQPKLPGRALLKVAGAGVLGVGVGQLAQALGVAKTSASLATVISAMIPIFFVVFAAVRLKQNVTRWQKLGLLLAFAGVGVVSLGKGDGLASFFDSSFEGVAWMLVSSVAVALAYGFSVELADKHGTLPVTAWSTIAGFLALVPFAAWEMSTTPYAFTVASVSSVLYLGLFVTVIGLFMWLSLLRKVPAGIAASVQYLQPVIGVIASAIMFGDHMGLMFVLGSGLVLIGLVLSTAIKSRTA